MVFCSVCDSTLYSEDELKCSVCNKVAHYFCQAQTQKNFRNMNKSKYKCRECKSTPSPTNEKTTGGEGKTPTKEDGKGKKETFEMVKNDTLQDYIDEKFRHLETRMVEMNEEIKNEINKRCLEMENKIKEKDEKIEELERRLDDMEVRNRMSNLEIRDVPETRGENVVEIVSRIGKAIGIKDIREGDIQVAHRVFTKRDDRKKPIIALMGSRYLRNKWLEAFRKFKEHHNYEPLLASAVHDGFPATPIHVNEHLTVARKMLLGEVRGFARENNIKYVWVRDGVILVKKEDKGKTYRVTTPDELTKIKGIFNLRGGNDD